MSILSSTVAPEIVKTNAAANSDDKVRIMTTLGFQGGNGSVKNHRQHAVLDE